MKRSVGLILLFLMLNSWTVYADDTVRKDFDVIPLTEEWVDGILEVNEYHYYPIDVEEEGKLHVMFQSFIDYNNADFLDQDLVTIEEQFMRGSAGMPDTVEFDYVLMPGRYYIRCTGNPNSSGEYRIKAGFESLNCNETEPNDDYHTAQILQQGDVAVGANTREDSHDYYQFCLDEDQKVKIVVNVDENDSSQRFHLFDEDLVQITEELNLQGYVYEEELKAGTYYIDIDTPSAERGQGAYTLKFGEKAEESESTGEEAEESTGEDKEQEEQTSVNVGENENK